MTKAVQTRRLFTLLLATAALGGCGQASSKPAAVVPDDVATGNPNAKVTVIEYASVACPVCGKWYREVFPAFKAKHIDTGRARFVSREMLVGGSGEVSAAAAGFLLARCAGPDKYLKVADAIYRNQNALFSDIKGTLLNVAKSVGMTEAQFTSCIQDEAALKALKARVKANAKGGVNATPTFVINGKALEAGYHPLADLDAAIA